MADRLSNASPPHGRGTGINPPNRFERLSVLIEPDDDVPPAERVATTFYRDTTRTIIATNDSPDVGFDCSINPYRGCEHGCIYCYARPFHEYLGLSAGIDFETKIFVKEQAPELLREELMSPRWKPQPIGLAGVTDVYQPAEKRLQLTRRCLQVLLEFRNPVVLITKNALITRDIDILSAMAAENLVSVTLSVTTLDADLQRKLEPRASTPRARLDAIRTLASAGIPVNVNMAPIIPGFTDEEIPALLAAIRDAGARSAHHTMLRLPHANKELFEDWLAREVPLRRDKVLARLRDLYGGKLYDADWKNRMSGSGPHADQINRLFAITLRRLGLQGDTPPLHCNKFHRPHGQLELFG